MLKPFPLTLQLLQHSHLHLQHLFGLLGRLHLQRHVDPRQQIHRLVDLPEAPTPNLFYLEKETLCENCSVYSDRVAFGIILVILDLFLFTVVDYT